jgi:hypothetical protein
MAALHRNWSVKHRNDLIRELRLNSLALRTKHSSAHLDPEECWRTPKDGRIVKQGCALDGHTPLRFIRNGVAQWSVRSCQRRLGARQLPPHAIWSDPVRFAATQTYDPPEITA